MIANGAEASGRTIARIVSGGQTGVDRAALDVAAALGIARGGWIPRGRRTEGGPLPDDYPLRETRSDAYTERTRLNVRDADATLVLTRGRPTRGTAVTIAFARRLGRPHLIVDIAHPPPESTVRGWLARHRVRVLNVAGPRESHAAGIYAEASRFLNRLLTSTGG